MGIVYGLLTAVGFGTADLFVTHSTRRVGPLRSVYLIQLFGLLTALGIAIVVMAGPPPISLTWLWALLFGIVDFAGIYCLYRAFSVGALSVCSPIASSYAVVTAFLAWATGERLPGPVWLGTAVLVFGIVLVSRGASPETVTMVGVPFAFASALFLGITSWGMDIVADDWGWLWPVIATRAVMLLCAAIPLVRAGQASPRPEHGAGRVLLAAALLDTAALITFNLGLIHAYTTTTTALGSLYNAVAVLLAWLFLKERLARIQWAGLGAILLGILFVSL